MILMLTWTRITVIVICLEYGASCRPPCSVSTTASYIGFSYSSLKSILCKGARDEFQAKAAAEADAATLNGEGRAEAKPMGDAATAVVSNGDIIPVRPGVGGNRMRTVKQLKLPKGPKVCGVGQPTHKITPTVGVSAFVYGTISSMRDNRCVGINKNESVVLHEAKSSK